MSVDRHNRHATYLFYFFFLSFLLNAFEAKGLVIFIVGSFFNFSVCRLRHFTAHCFIFIVFHFVMYW